MSRFGKLYTESRCWWECGYKSYSEWPCEGSLKSIESRRLRELRPLSVECIWWYAKWEDVFFIHQAGWYRRS